MDDQLQHCPVRNAEAKSHPGHSESEPAFLTRSQGDSLDISV